MVINELPVGSRVRFGRYAIANRDPVEIDWIKVSKQNHFISEKALLGMKFDEFETNYCFNSNYSESNIRQFMNSDEFTWFHPTTPNDRSTEYITFDSYITVDMKKYRGLLYYFTDHELSLIEKQNGDYLRLPTAREIDGGFPYFKRYGKRARPMDEYGYLERSNYKPGMYCAYYVDDGRNDGYVTEFDKSGNFNNIRPAHYSGVRPVCRLYELSEVIETGKNTYKMNLSSSEPVKFFKETQSIDWLLGI